MAWTDGNVELLFIRPLFKTPRVLEYGVFFSRMIDGIDGK